MLKFGVQLLVQFPTSSAQSNQETALFYRNMVEQIGLIEQHDYFSVWLGEHHVIKSARFPPIATLASIASLTKRVKVGSSVVLLPLYNPLHLAENLSMIDIISNGRLILGVASGYRQEEFDAFGVTINQRSGRLEEGVEILKRLWTEDDVTFAGKYFHMHHVWINPKPIQKPRPPIFIGGSTEAAIRRAARIGDGWLMQGNLPRDSLKDQHKIFEETLRSIGYRMDSGKTESEMTKTIGLVAECFVSKNKEDAIRISAPAVLAKFSENRGWGERWFGNDLPQDVQDRFIIGSPEDCIDRIESYNKEFGVTHFILRFQLPGIDHKNTMEAIKLFGERVIPYFAGKS